jgi:ABC-2 type transport system ATP-binding protein
MLQFVNFSKYYADRRIMAIEEFYLGPGIYWIKGANGSGKSTLLRSVAGMLAFKGDILLNEVISLRKQSVPYRRLVNFGEAEPVFPGFLTGADLVTFFLAAKGGVFPDLEQLIWEMNMEQAIHEAVSTYSSGTLKKLSLILAFTGHPKLILLDEPLTTIDAGTIKILHNWIRDFYTNGGVSFMITSHQELDPAILPQAEELFVQFHTLNRLI